MSIAVLLETGPHYRLNCDAAAGKKRMPSRISRHKKIQLDNLEHTWYIQENTDLVVIASPLASPFPCCVHALPVSLVPLVVIVVVVVAVVCAVLLLRWFLASRGGTTRWLIPSACLVRERS